MKLLGRLKEQKKFKHHLDSTESRLIAVYGRRRIGKTFLIRNYFTGQIQFEVSGLFQGDMADQITHFTNTIAKYGFYNAILTQPKDWMSTFDLLGLYIDSIKGSKKKVLFLDELPWFDTPRSKFLMAFENFWNSYCSKRNDLLVVICGSAASWMIQKILKNKGGLHNRVAETINLQAFNLYETEKFLKTKGIIWSQYDIAQLYMTIGGVPYYLDAIRKGESVIQFVNRACFDTEGLLYNEYDELYASLFKNNERHESIVEVLAHSPKGITRKRLIKKSNLPSGGTLTKTLTELEESGFIEKAIPFDANQNGAYYKLVDHFTIFYFQFMYGKGRRITDDWTKKLNHPSWRSWSGLAFERICSAHIAQIKIALGLQAIESHVSSWQGKSETEQGAQIDLLIDRADRIINVCEIKFSHSTFEINKAQAQNLRNKLATFAALPQNKRKTLFLTMITTFGVRPNAYQLELVQNEVVLEDLFRND